MNSNELRALQAPLKESYKARPDTALATLAAEGRVDTDVACVVRTWAGDVRAGLHPATGGDGKSACSGDMLLEALVACAGVTLAAVATAMGIELRSATIRAEGSIDFRGTLGVAKEARVGFSSVRLSFELDSDASDEKLEKLLELTERYCVVYQTLQRPPTMESSRVRAATY